jgi:hypothetical protein
MNIVKDNWFEIWYEPGPNFLPGYTVVVTRKPESNGKIIVLDINKQRQLYAGVGYEDVSYWLCEDEFEKVTGREFFFEGDDDNWFEVWFIRGNGGIPARILLITPNPRSLNDILVLDIDRNETLYIGITYEDASSWLAEKNFELVKGREPTIPPV